MATMITSGAKQEGGNSTVLWSSVDDEPQYTYPPPVVRVFICGRVIRSSGRTGVQQRGFNSAELGFFLIVGEGGAVVMFGGVFGPGLEFGGELSTFFSGLFRVQFVMISYVFVGRRVFHRGSF